MSTEMSNAKTVTASGIKNPYHLVQPSHWPIIGAFGAMFFLMGIIFAAHFGNYIVLALGLCAVLTIMFFWFRTWCGRARFPARIACSTSSACATG